MDSINKITMKRINGDLKLFEKTNLQYFDIFPNKDNILEIYFLMWGRPETPYEGGAYLGKIVHSHEYPFKAPDYYVLTPNGRFNVNNKICLTNSAFHQEHWAPAAWNLVSILEGFSSVWHSEFKEDKIGISHITNVPESKLKKMADDSVKYNMTHLSNIYNQFPKVNSGYNPYSVKSEEYKN